MTTAVLPASVAPISGPGPVHLPPTPSHSPLVAPKRLRSCLSPTRRYPSNPLDSVCPPPSAVSVPVHPSIPMSQFSTISVSTDEPSLTYASSPMTSRSASFSSTCDGDDGERFGWRAPKSVRWVEGEEQGCVMAAYYSTWSADDYDRSPLEPPKPEERACILPARGSRCLSPISRFTDSPSMIPHLSLNNSPCNSPGPSSPVATLDTRRAEVEAEAEAEEDRQWEECMARRQMMFAQMQLQMQMQSLSSRPSAPGDGHRSSDEPNERDIDRAGFEGYTSLTATLSAMLSATGVSTEPRDVSTPVGTPQEGESVLEMAMKSRRLTRSKESSPEVQNQGSGEEVNANIARGRPMLIRRIPPVVEESDEDVEEEEDSEDDEEDEEEADDDDYDDDDDEEDVRQPSLATVLAALKDFRRNGPLLGTGDEQRDRIAQSV